MLTVIETAVFGHKGQVTLEPGEYELDNWSQEEGGYVAIELRGTWLRFMSGKIQLT
jgi:hypothetical protein